MSKQFQIVIQAEVWETDGRERIPFTQIKVGYDGMSRAGMVAIQEEFLAMLSRLHELGKKVLENELSAGQPQTPTDAADVAMWKDYWRWRQNSGDSERDKDATPETESETF